MIHKDCESHELFQSTTAFIEYTFMSAMDSKHKQLLSPVIEDNTIALMNVSKTIDMRLKLRQVDANGFKSDVQFRHSPHGEDNVFVALFDDNDIDFEIGFDNRSIKRRMAFTMTYGKEYEYIISGGLAKLVALETNGNHLRFLSPNKPMANLVVDLVAQKAQISRESSEILCSRIGFAFEAEKRRQKVDDNRKITINISQMMGKIIEKFIADEDIEIKPFVIELRIRDKHSLSFN
ncbi:unnamed protein product [Oppiella nova]|uniref:Uncharacterized protein n=1 Tax=Oppiella nova TaxID=334625 RepID=A0A7R9M0Q5_9ACAR|nr:unnamed protein product [Oppiella nova]CAG2168825.1 unnamed protein product [Oppiella nova]